VTGRGVERFRVQIREVLGFRFFSRGDEDKMIAWLAEEVCPSELNEDRQREAVLARCRAEKIEPPGRMSRIIGSANRIADERFCALTISRLSADVAQSLWSLIADTGDVGEDEEDEPSFFTELKADPGKLGLETLLSEITKLKRVRAIGLPADLFDDVAEKRVARWRARCGTPRADARAAALPATGLRGCAARLGERPNPPHQGARWGGGRADPGPGAVRFLSRHARPAARVLRAAPRLQRRGDRRSVVGQGGRAGTPRDRRRPGRARRDRARLAARRSAGGTLISHARHDRGRRRDEPVRPAFTEQLAGQ
jgi:hypothetical protein